MEGPGARELLLGLAGSTMAESFTFGALICIKCSRAPRSLGFIFPRWRIIMQLHLRKGQVGEIGMAKSFFCMV
ncbi:hypothetical protein ZWY2020_040641 [Hordeum vulgare]|nr:hypothetical protein ZWY2020_040641 [Hordeum vulgare]